MNPINVIGLGYIGLPTALILASHHQSVIGSDVNSNVIESLRQGRLSFDEVGLENLFHDAIKAGIEFETNTVSTNMYIVAVPTPYDKQSKKIDPRYVINAVEGILKVCMDNAIIVIESTVSPGTMDRFIRPLVSNQSKTIHLAHAPERIIPGNMIYELKHNSRTIGADSLNVGEAIKKVYASFCEGEIVLTDIRTAEMTKVVENTYRDINIAFANELAKICRSDNMDVYEIIKIANKHPRVNILSPGPGVGGHCISVDPWFLLGDYPGLANIILTARNINDSMPEFVLNRISEIMKEHHMSDFNRVGLYGLTYKENVDDTRESPTLQLLDAMKKHLAPPLKTFDPWVKKPIVENQVMDFDAFISGIDLVVIMVAHHHLHDHLDKLENKIIFDTKNSVKLKKSYQL